VRVLVWFVGMRFVIIYELLLYVCVCACVCDEESNVMFYLVSRVLLIDYKVLNERMSTSA